MAEEPYPVVIPGLAGHSWLRRAELGWLAANVPASGLLVEVGTAAGVTAAVLADAAPGLTILCVDTFVDLDAPHVAGPDPLRPTLWVRNRRPNMRLFVGTLVDLLALALVEADAVFVDGDHSEAGVAADLEGAVAMLAPGGTIFVHDYGDGHWTGVKPAVDRFCAKHGFRVGGDVGTIRRLDRP